MGKLGAIVRAAMLGLMVGACGPEEATGEPTDTVESDLTAPGCKTPVPPWINGKFSFTPSYQLAVEQVGDGGTPAAVAVLLSDRSISCDQFKTSSYPLDLRVMFLVVRDPTGGVRAAPYDLPGPLGGQGNGGGIQENLADGGVQTDAIYDRGMVAFSEVSSTRVSGTFLMAGTSLLLTPGTATPVTLQGAFATAHLCRLP